MRIVLGVGGGIAAYKALELVRLLQANGHQVQVVMTAGAQQFIQPLSFASLTGYKVITGMFSHSSAQETLSSAVEHIGVAQDNEMLIVAPATADVLAKFAAGLADDFLSTLYLAFRGQVVLAPAMNTGMWEHPATQANLATLRNRGCSVVDPDEGWLACGTIGAGRLANPLKIAEHVETVTRGNQDLEGETVVVSAGPTQEPIDPVRYISNRSSGKMGYAIAEAAARRGAKVILVSGPVSIAAPPKVQVIPIQTAQQMRKAVMEHLEQSTIIIKSAAVADYHIAHVSTEKLKKTATRLSLALDPTPDILAEVGRLKGDRLLIGFAAETGNLLEEARRKMTSKNCDMIVANLVNKEGLGFESDQNEVEILIRSGQRTHVGPASKKEVAERILDQVATLHLSLRAADLSA
jgi:phosphopantothenoylcysteine decarboxylase / phosphopantothenate---cysteine ligase